MVEVGQACSPRHFGANRSGTQIDDAYISSDASHGETLKRSATVPLSGWTEIQESFAVRNKKIRKQMKVEEPDKKAVATVKQIMEESFAERNARIRAQLYIKLEVQPENSFLRSFLTAAINLLLVGSGARPGYYESQRVLQGHLLLLRSCMPRFWQRSQHDFRRWF